MTLVLSSPAFANNSEIPKRHTCDGSAVSPPLNWSGVPSQAKSLVLIVDDPDAPDPANPRGTWVHWLVYNLPPTTTGLAEGATTHLPSGTRQGVNDSHQTGYSSPCPPIGRHRYVHKLYALDTVLSDLKSPNKAKLEAAMLGHVIDSAELVGTYRH